MKFTIILFSVAAISLASFAWDCPLGEVKIDGLLGIKTGIRVEDVDLPHDKEPEIMYSQYQKGEVLSISYGFVPKTDFRGYTSYKFYLDTVGKRIERIVVGKELSTQQEVWDETETVVGLFEKKYGIKFARAPSGLLLYMWDGGAYIKNRSWYNRLSISPSFGPRWDKQGNVTNVGRVTIEFEDKTVKAKAQKEETDARQRRIKNDTRGIDVL